MPGVNYFVDEEGSTQLVAKSLQPLKLQKLYMHCSPTHLTHLIDKQKSPTL